DQDMVPKISDALKQISTQTKEFTIQLSKIGAFPNIKKPRVIWIGIEKGSESLKTLNIKIETGFEKLGFEKEKREYKAHLTLGRVRSLKNISQLTKVIEEIDFKSEKAIKIDKLILFQSTLTSKGAIYTPLITVTW
ncbi:MAG: RNA 2',3'-cyclic phosphodiesterase, partial [Candidatus Omnitrophota bacterium]|nr:RNA 2',3'-cyclic phosphodiesterase [Candidatus Omnitrophota bacterium]